MDRLILLLVVCLMGGCATTQKSVPSGITLENALKDVRDGIALLGEGDKENTAGLLVSEVSVTFNIAAEAKNSTELKVDLSPGSVFKEIPSASYGKSSSYEEGRGNQITFKFQNVAFAGKDTLLGLSSQPETLTVETITTEDKGKRVTTEKRPYVHQQLPLGELVDLVKNKFIVTKK